MVIKGREEKKLLLVIVLITLFVSLTASAYLLPILFFTPLSLGLLIIFPLGLITGIINSTIIEHIRPDNKEHLKIIIITLITAGLSMMFSIRAPEVVKIILASTYLIGLIIPEIVKILRLVMKSDGKGGSG